VSTDGVVAAPELFVLRDAAPGRPFWPTTARASAYLAAAKSDRYFRFEIPVPPVSLDDAVVVLASQRYLAAAASFDPDASAAGSRSLP